MINGDPFNPQKKKNEENKEAQPADVSKV